MKNKKVRFIALYGVMIALAMIFSYVDALVPMPIPGVKLGLANIVVMFALYSMRPIDAFIIAIVRVILSGIIFSPSTIPYSLAGGLLSLVVMWLLKKTKLSIIGVSIAGGVCHNIGQIVVAIIITKTAGLSYYLPFLLVAGLVTGLLMGIVANIVVKRIRKI